MNNELSKKPYKAIDNKKLSCYYSPVRTFIPKNKDLVKEFQVVDAAGMVLGRLCARIASILRGKDKTIVTPGFNCGDHVIVINSDKIALTSNKLDTAIHYTHSGYWGNLKEMTMRYRMEKDSREVIRTAVKRMLGRGPLARERLRSLFVYKGIEHDKRSIKIRDPRECSMFRLGKERLDRSKEGISNQMIPQKPPLSSVEGPDKKKTSKSDKDKHSHDVDLRNKRAVEKVSPDSTQEPVLSSEKIVTKANKEQKVASTKKKKGEVE